MESEEPPLGPDEALTADVDTRRAIAANRFQPRWYAAGLGLVMGMLAASRGVPPGPWQWGVLLVSIVTLLGLVLAVRSARPFVVNGWRNRLTRQTFAAYVVGLAVLVLLGFLAERLLAQGWVWFLIAGIAFAWTLYGLERMNRAWQEEPRTT